jgi:2'-5' RNA ligase
MIRTFVAFDTPEMVKEKIMSLQTILKNTNADVRWEAKEKMHVTVSFLGDVAEQSLASLEMAIANVVKKYSSFNVTYSELGCFPNWNEPRVVWIGCEENGGVLRAIKRDLDASLLPFGIAIEKRKFFPHITLGRIKSPQHIFDLLQSMENLTFSPQIATVNEILFIKSVLKRNGSEYSLLQSFPLFKK